MNSIKTILTQAPSNIAWVKYMGKNSAGLPENPSLSMTLKDLCSYAELTPAADLRWSPELPNISNPPRKLLGITLDEKGRARILSHLSHVLGEAPNLLQQEGIETNPSLRGFTLKTCNTFPAASGIASSASSFAAVTLAALQASAKDPAAFAARWNQSPALKQKASKLAGQGSGSASRSMEGPFVFWSASSQERTAAHAISHSLRNVNELSHFVLIISAQAKEVSSSQAHIRVKSSPLWVGRVERATSRAQIVRAHLERGELAAISTIAWQEAWEMHSLFHTSEEPFSYWQPHTLEVLKWLRTRLTQALGSPIVTLDAGPNIHLTVPTSFASTWKKDLQANFPQIELLEDKAGQGALCLNC